jgi:hypothetical protein
VDLNGDGLIDILSGSYSHFESDMEMAGLFQVLYGLKAGGFKKPAVLNGSDGKPLVIPNLGKDDDHDLVARICTRPTACDLNGDGKLELVVGNFGGSFFLFRGQGEGKFDPVATLLNDASGAALHVDSHSDPFLVDWDGDGDLDIVSGTAGGGVYLSLNNGSKNKPAFATFTTLIKQPEEAAEVVTADDSNLKAPGPSTRVWVEDVNGDGKLDLLVGDSQRLVHPKLGVDFKVAQEQ